MLALVARDGRTVADKPLADAFVSFGRKLLTSWNSVRCLP